MNEKLLLLRKLGNWPCRHLSSRKFYASVKMTCVFFFSCVGYKRIHSALNSDMLFRSLCSAIVEVSQNESA